MEGLANFKEEVLNTCRHAYLYNDCAGFIPPSLIIQLDAHNGRTTAVRYIADEYKKANVLDFYTGINDYIELEFNETLSRAEEELAKITAAADYGNKFSGIIGADVIALSQNTSAAQLFLDGFFENFDGVALFFVPEKPSESERRFIEQMLARMERIKIIPADSYSASDYFRMLEQRLYSSGVLVSGMVSDDKLLKVITDANVKNIRELDGIIRLLLLHADFSGETPLVTPESVKNTLCTVKEIKK
ncbi:MAG: hypothetical protein IKI78_06010 [Clostridia bacterium]|nr:hypothetical protein [Clostridia bacterium]